MSEQMVVKYSIADAEIAKLSEQYLALRLTDPKDKSGYEAVHAARMDVKGKRVQVEKTRVELKAEALRYGRAVDSEAKRLTALLEPIEEHLEKQESVWTAEQERIKREREQAAAAKLQERISDLQAFGAPIDVAALKAMSDEDFIILLKKAAVDFEEAEKRREEEAEEAARKAEAERVEREKREAEQRAERERLAKEKAEADKARKEAEDKQRAAERALAEAQEATRAAERKLQAEKDRIAAEQRAKEDEDRREQEKAELDKRHQELLPIREKLKGLSKAIGEMAERLDGIESDHSEGSLLYGAKQILMNAAKAMWRHADQG